MAVNHLHCDLAMGFISLVVLALNTAVIAVVGAAHGAAPQVTLDHGTFTGVTDGIATRFLGIPFAKPAYAVSVPLPRYKGLT